MLLYTYLLHLDFYEINIFKYKIYKNIFLISSYVGTNYNDYYIYSKLKQVAVPLC